jgi:hypothetical protein
VAEPRLCEAEVRIAARRQELLLAVEAIFEPPQLRAVGADQQIEAVAVGEFAILRAFGGVAGFEFLESYLGVLRRCLRGLPQKMPPNANRRSGIRRHLARRFRCPRLGVS